MADIQSAAAEITRGKKERKKKKIEITGQKYNGLRYYIGRPLIIFRRLSSPASHPVSQLISAVCGGTKTMIDVNVPA